jgi:hypothetical protein
MPAPYVCSAGTPALLITRRGRSKVGFAKVDCANLTTAYRRSNLPGIAALRTLRTITTAQRGLGRRQ